MTAKVLPTFKGYTVDLQEQKFRRAVPGKKSENIHFLSSKRKKLFAALEKFAIEIVEYYDYK